MQKQKGFTLGGLLGVFIAIFAIIVVFWYLVIGTVVKGNFWFTEGGVFRELRVAHPEVSEILITTRNINVLSDILVVEGGVKKNYKLDTDILFNYVFSE